MRKARLTKAIALLAILLALYGCTTASTGKAQSAQVQSLIQARETGVNSAEQQDYLSTVLPSDTVLLKEETNLIRAAGVLGIKDYNLTEGTVNTQQDGICTAKLTQTYTVSGEKRECEYTALFKTEDGKLYYDGPDFKIKQNDLVKVYYTDGRDSLAQQLLNEETTVLQSMKDQLGFVPKGFISIKLFDDQQVFLQSVKLDLPAWVGGWQEFGESIKSYTGAWGTDGANYKQMLNHETTHRMVSELSNDNASYWIQEGLAGVYQDSLDAPGQPLLTQEEAAGDFTPYAQQKNIDLEKLGMDDGAAVTEYYATSKAFVAFMVDQYGWDKVKQTLEYMQKYELIPVTGAEKITETNERTTEAIGAVLNLKTDEEFQSAFDHWLATYTQD